MPNKNIQKAIVTVETELKDLLKALDEAPEFRIVLVVEDSGRLVGAVTDGDVRRAILRGAQMNEPAKHIMNPNPVTLPADAPSGLQKSTMIKRGVKQVAIVDESLHVLNIVTLDSLSAETSMPNKVFLMAGGLGSRLMPLTESIPKPMLQVGGKPILQTIIENFVSEGFVDFYLSVNYRAEVIKDYFGDGERFGCKIAYIEEEARMGTAGALSLIKEKSREPMIVMNGDLLTRVKFRNILDFHNDHQACATMAVREYHFQVPFGVVELDGSAISCISEKPVHNFFVNAGIYVISPEAMTHIPHNTFYDMPTLFEDLKKAGRHNVAFPLREYWIDIGHKEQLEVANHEYDSVFID